MYLILFSLSLILFISLLCARDARRRATTWRKQFPPISNQEFLERCTLGTHAYIALKVRKVLSESLGVEYERIYPESRIYEDLGAE